MASRDDDKAMDGLLRRSLTRDAAVGDCPAPDILAAYQEGSLQGEELTRHELHFSRCARCREQLAAIARAGAEVEIPALDARAAAAQASPAIAASDLRPGGVRPRRRFWLFDWRFLAPVAAVLAFTAILYTQFTRRAEKPSGFNNEIAMSKPAPLPAPASPPPSTAEARPSDYASRPSAPIAPSADQHALAKKTTTPKPAQLAPTERDRNLSSPNAGNTANAPVPSAVPPAYKNPSPGPAYSASKGEEVGRPFVNSGGASAGARTTTSTAGKVSAAPAPPSPAPLGPAPAAAETTSADTVAPPAAEPQKSEEKAASTTMSVQVQSAATTVQGVPEGRVARAQAEPKTKLALKDQADQVIAKRELHEQLIKTPNPAVIYRIADGGFIERTQDSGTTWQGELVDPNAEFTAGAAPGARVCWLAGRDGAIYLSKDGNNWTKIPPPAQVDFVAVAAMDASSATVTSADGRKFSTRNGGKTWTLLK